MYHTYEYMLGEWAKKVAEVRKWRALYEKRNDADCLNYAKEAEKELEMLDKLLSTMEENL